MPDAKYFLISLIFLAAPVFAHCPACTFATGAAVATARFYGLDDMVVGVFIGAFILSSGLWFSNYLMKRNKGNNYIPLQTFLIPTSVFVLSLLGISEIIKTSGEAFGFNKMLLGIAAGSFASVLAFEFHKALHGFNNGKNFIPLQAIFVALLFLAAFSAAFYYMGWI